MEHAREDSDRRRRPREPAVATVEHVATRTAVTTEDLYRRHGQRVLRYCQRCLRRRTDAEDALQQTFLQAHRALDRGVEPVAEVQWLLAIARNVCLTRADALRRRSATELAIDPDLVAGAASPVPGDAGASPELQAAFARLPQRQRDALFLREWQELSYAEIADALGISESAVETLIFRARRTLARELEPARRRQALGPLGLLGWIRGGFGSATVKLVVGAAVATTAAGTAVTVVLERPAASPPVRTHVATPASTLRDAAPVASLPAPTRTTPKRAPHPTVEAPSTQALASPIEPPPAASGPSRAPVTAATPSTPRSQPAATASSPSSSSETEAPGPVTTVTTQVSGAVSSAVGQTATAVGSTVDAVAATVTTAAPATAPVVAPVSGAVSTATATTAATADAGVNTVQDAVDATTSLTSKLLPGH